jgi:hypothetical protein
MNKYYSFYLITGVLFSAFIFDIDYVVMQANANILTGILKSIPALASTAVGLLSAVNEGIESSFGIYDKLTGKTNTDSQSSATTDSQSSATTDSQSSATTDSQVTEINDLKKQVSQLENQISMLPIDEKAIADREFSNYFVDEIAKYPQQNQPNILDNLDLILSPPRVDGIKDLLRASHALSETICTELDPLAMGYTSTQDCINFQNEVRDNFYINEYGSNTFKNDHPSNSIINSEPPAMEINEYNKNNPLESDVKKSDVPNLRL